MKLTQREIAICNYTQNVISNRAECLERALKTRKVDEIIREVKESISVLNGEAKILEDEKQINTLVLFILHYG